MATNRLLTIAAAMEAAIGIALIAAAGPRHAASPE
jgi:hypothetical protein